jgi:hypothetical protein
MPLKSVLYAGSMSFNQIHGEGYEKMLYMEFDNQYFYIIYDFRVSLCVLVIYRLRKPSDWQYTARTDRDAECVAG